jgi:hypothetical protein
MISFYVSGSSEMRGDMPLRWLSEAENEVPAFPQEAHEYKAKQGPDPLPSSLEDIMENHQRVSISMFV